MQNLYAFIPKKKVYLCILTYIIAFFFKIVMVYIISVLFNDIVARQTERMLQTILLFVAVAVLVRALNYLNTALSNEIGLKIHAGLHTSFYESILHIEVPRAQAEDAASIAQRHLGKIQDYLLKKHITLAVEVIRMIMALAYIAFVSWQLLLFSLTAFPLVLVITGILGGKIQQLNHSIQQKHRKLTICAWRRWRAPKVSAYIALVLLWEKVRRPVGRDLFGGEEAGKKAEHGQ